MPLVCGARITTNFLMGGNWPETFQPAIQKMNREMSFTAEKYGFFYACGYKPDFITNVNLFCLIHDLNLLK
jgi:hypothetical protein